MLEPGHLVMLISPEGKRYIRPFDPKDTLHTKHGTLAMSDVDRAGVGGTARTHLGHEYRIVKPGLYDLVKNLKRQTQIIYPKEIGYIVLKLGVGPGARIIEAGSGSGGLTTALAWLVGDQGRVYTYERRPEFHDLCAKNLKRAGLDHRVSLYHMDIAEGFVQDDAHALFLDVRTPWDYLDQVAAAVLPGAPVGFLLPTTNQISELLAALENKPFTDVEVMEIMLRRYKPVAERLRPFDRMVAHTGYLVFTRTKNNPPLPQTQPEPGEPQPDAPENQDQPVGEPE